MSPEVSMHDGYFWVGGEKIPPLSGEFHFWRNTRIYWPRILNSIQDLGFKHLATYVHWDFHQLSPGDTPLGQIEYDFTGATNPQRDLAGYLDLIDKSDLWLNIRPGPYIYAETEFSGPPRHADALHRNHPDFIAMAKDYLNAVCPVIKPHLATNGGRVFICQVDNEVSTIRHQEQVLEGPVDQLGSWASFLKQKYGEVSDYNERYGTGYDDWEEIEPVLL
ncbi:MAG TPA: beta-galactosidase, partial [Candidatus Lokiarchaeia archaeon]|nr:beta-galactosidase [Candidatus Lokiarchaeia archaeon]